MDKSHSCTGLVISWHFVVFKNSFQKVFRFGGFGLGVTVGLCNRGVRLPSVTVPRNEKKTHW